MSSIKKLTKSTRIVTVILLFSLSLKKSDQKSTSSETERHRKAEFLKAQMLSNLNSFVNSPNEALEPISSTNELEIRRLQQNEAFKPIPTNGFDSTTSMPHFPMPLSLPQFSLPIKIYSLSQQKPGPSSNTEPLQIHKNQPLIHLPTPEKNSFESRPESNKNDFINGIPALIPNLVFRNQSTGA